MNGRESIIRKVLDGLVLDEKGFWVPIIHKAGIERDFRSHLEKGEVLYKKKWVTLSVAKAESKLVPEITTLPTFIPPETRRITISRVSQSTIPENKVQETREEPVAVDEWEIARAGNKKIIFVGIIGVLIALALAAWMFLPKFLQ